MAHELLSRSALCLSLDVRRSARAQPEIDSAEGNTVEGCMGEGRGGRRPVAKTWTWLINFMSSPCSHASLFSRLGQVRIHKSPPRSTAHERWTVEAYEAPLSCICPPQVSTTQGWVSGECFAWVPILT